MKPAPHIQSLCKASYLVATEKGYTKHYYAESERIASKIGGKNFRLTIFDFRMNKLSSNENYLDHNIVAGSILSTQYHTLPSSHNRLSKIENRQSYHPDHLGSSSWITYSDGKFIQHLHYPPFGESFVDQRISSFGSRYTFSAKEKDVETGYGYFGARYYSSDLSIWLSVDPMSDKYPTMSPYVYCANNPVKLVDPNGEDYETVVDKENKTITIKATYYTANENKEKISESLQSWNNQSGKFAYTIGKGKNKESYTINFDLQLAEGNYETTADAMDAFSSDKSGTANYIEMSDPRAKGSCNYGNIIQINPQTGNNNRTRCHEIGHTLGMYHRNNSIMESGGSSLRFSAANIRHTIKGMYQDKGVIWGGGDYRHIGKCKNLIGGKFNGKVF